MKKRKTLYLQRESKSSIGNQASIVQKKPMKSRKPTMEEDSPLKSKEPATNLLKPFLHKDKTTKTYLYLGKKIKILLGDH